MRLQKFLAHCGVGARRLCEKLIAEGKVSVNGRIVTQMGVKVDPEHDEVRLEGRAVRMPAQREYWMINKPPGVISTVHDTHGRPTVLDLLPAEAAHRRLYPVGRLDADSTGLVLLTDDGQMALGLTHPRYGVEKEYLVVLDRELPPRALARLRKGLVLDDGPVQPVRVEKLTGRRANGQPQQWRVVLKEGRKRIIRRMFEEVGCSVRVLHRVRIGPLVLGRLRPGGARRLTPREVADLKKAVQAHRRRSQQ